MSPHAWTEDQLIEQPAIGLFAERGWQTVSAREETLGPNGTLGRETRGEVVLPARLRAALAALNPGLGDEALNQGIDEQIGWVILARQGRGTKAVERQALDPRNAIPDMKGFSPRNLKYMRSFARAWPDAEFVQGVLAHFRLTRVLLPRLFSGQIDMAIPCP